MVAAAREHDSEQAVGEDRVPGNRVAVRRQLGAVDLDAVLAVEGDRVRLVRSRAAHAVVVCPAREGDAVSGVAEWLRSGRVGPDQVAEDRVQGGARIPDDDSVGVVAGDDVPRDGSPYA